MSPDRRDTLIATALAVATAIVFAPSLGADFVLYDDPEYVTENPWVRRGLTPSSVAWAFTHWHAANWHPLTWLSHMLDVTLFGLSPAGHHATNIAWHALAVALLYRALVAMTADVGRSALVAALFGLHPLRVESVTWVAERKDVIAAACWTAGLWAYAQGRSRLVGAAFIAGLMAKPMVVTFPAALLLLDRWPLRRRWSWRLVSAKWPLFVAAAVVCVVTVLAQRAGGAVVDTVALPFTRRVAGAAIAYATYLRQTVWPVGLAVFYPQRDWPVVQVAGAVALLVAITAVAWAARDRRPAALVGWCWFLGTLVPVIGLVKVGDQAYADRFTYLPHIGLFMGVVWSVAMPRWIVRGVVGAAVAACVTLTVRQQAVWASPITLFRHAVDVVADNGMAEGNLAAALLAAGHVEEAAEHAARAMTLVPRLAKPYVTAGAAALAQNDLVRAEALFVEATARDPSLAVAHFNVGVVQARANRLAEAEAAYRRAVALDAMLVKAHVNLGNVLAAQGQHAAAAAAQRAALAVDPVFVPAWVNLGIALERGGQVDDAIAAHERAASLLPSEPLVWMNLGSALGASGRTDEARAAFTTASRLRPEWEDPRRALEALSGR